MKSACILFLALLIHSGVEATTSSRWEAGWVLKSDGDTLRGEIRNQKFYPDKVVARINGKRVRIPIAEIEQMQAGGEQWFAIAIPALENQRVLAREEGEPQLYESKIEEVKCTCDNSYQSRQVRIWKAGNELFVFKKRHFGGALINWEQLKKSIAKHLETDVSQLPEKLKYHEVPELISRFQ